MKLLKLYECFFGIDDHLRDYAHFADADVEMTWKIFQYYKGRVTSVEELSRNQAVENTFLNWQDERDYNVRRLRLPPLSSTVLGGALV